MTPLTLSRRLALSLLLVGASWCSAASAIRGPELLVNGSLEHVEAWVLETKASGSSPARSGQILPPDSTLVQSIAGSTLVAGRAYVLRVGVDKAPGSGQVSVIFRLPEWKQSFRTFTVRFDASKGETVELAFTAPEYAQMAEVRLENSGRESLRPRLVSLMRRAAIDHTQAISSLANSHVPEGYRLVFNDEFNGTALDRSKWYTRFIYNGETLDHLTDERQRYRDNDNHQVLNGVLKLVARKNAEGTYESGMIRSDWTAHYGYFEVRVKMPDGRGVFPAFWLNSDVSSSGTHFWPPEFDIFEYVNNGVEDTPNMLHTGVVQQEGTTESYIFSDTAFDRRWTYWKAPYDFDKGWHTIGAEWTENTVSTFVDGQKIVERNYRWRYNNGSLAPKAYVMLNLAIGGAWAGRHGIDDARFPVSFEIDWVRVYQKPIATSSTR